MRADDFAVYHDNAAATIVNVMLTASTSLLLKRAVARSVPTLRSSNRCRIPAHKWCRNPHNIPMITSLTHQFENATCSAVKVSTEAKLRCKHHSSNGKARNKAAPLIRCMIETKPGNGSRIWSRFRFLGRFGIYLKMGNFGFGRRSLSIRLRNNVEFEFLILPANVAPQKNLLAPFRNAFCRPGNPFFIYASLGIATARGHPSAATQF